MCVNQEPRREHFSGVGGKRFNWDILNEGNSIMTDSMNVDEI